MAPKSSIIAKAVRNTLREIGTLLPSNENTHNEKARLLKINNGGFASSPKPDALPGCATPRSSVL